MKACEYCGGQNEAEATCCVGCGTPFSAGSTASFPDLARWARQSALGLALTSAAGVLLIASAAFLGLGKLLSDLRPASLWEPAAHGGYAVSFYMPQAVTWVLVAGAVVFTLVVCAVRCRKAWHGYAAAALAFAGALGLMAAPLMMVLFPSVFVGMITRSSLAFYVATVCQLAAGAWLLGWFRRKRAQNEEHNA